MKFFNDPTGRIWTGTVPDRFYNGGFSFSSNTALHRIGPAATDVWIGGVRASAIGEIVVDTTLGAFDSNNGIPCSSDPAVPGGIYRDAATLPTTVDHPVCGGSIVRNFDGALLINDMLPPIGAQQLINPEFTTDTTGWLGSGATLAWAAGVCVVTGTTFPASNLISQLIPSSAVQLGCSYYCEARIRNVTSNSGPRLRIARGSPGGNTLIAATSFVPGTTFVDVGINFVPRFSDLDITIQATAISVGEVFEVEYCRLWLLGMG